MNNNSLWFRTILIIIVTLVGLELPLLMRIVQAQVAFKDLVSHVLTFDYAGALTVVMFLLFIGIAAVANLLAGGDAGKVDIAD